MFAVLIGVLVLALLTFIVREGFLGYAPRDLACRTIGRKQQAVIAACADTLFPAGGKITLSGTDAGLVLYFDRQFAELPRDKRMLLSLLIVFVEHAPWIFGPDRGRFTRLSREHREAAMLAMSESPIYFRRLCFLSLRTILCMGYLANKDVERQIGSGPNLDPFAGRPPLAPNFAPRHAMSA